MQYKRKINKLAQLRKLSYWEGELGIRSKEGRIINTFESFFVILDDDGNPQYIAYIISDITERKLVELELKEHKENLERLVKIRTDELREKELGYRQLIDNLYTGVVVHAPDTSIRLFNPKALELLGLNSDEMLGKKAIDPSWSFVKEDGDYLPIEDYPVNLVISSGRRLENYLVGVDRPNKDLVWVLVNAFPEIADNGDLLQVIVTFVDITKQIQAGDDLRLSEEKFRLILDSTAEAIYGLDTDGKCTFCNAVCLKMLGYNDQQDLIGKLLHTIIHHTLPNGGTYEIDECKIHKSFEKSMGIHVNDEVFWRKDGTSFPVEYWSYPIVKNDIVIGVVVTFVDICRPAVYSD